VKAAVAKIVTSAPVPAPVPAPVTDMVFSSACAECDVRLGSETRSPHCVEVILMCKGENLITVKLTCIEGQKFCVNGWNEEDTPDIVATIFMRKLFVKLLQKYVFFLAQSKHVQSSEPSGATLSFDASGARYQWVDSSYVDTTSSKKLAAVFTACNVSNNHNPVCDVTMMGEHTLPQLSTSAANRDWLNKAAQPATAVKPNKHSILLVPANDNCHLL